MSSPPKLGMGPLGRCTFLFHRPGDEVYGDNLGLKGGFAEYAIAPESALAHKPEELTFAEASTIPQAAAIALQGIDGAGPGQRG